MTPSSLQLLLPSLHRQQGQSPTYTPCLIGFGDLSLFYSSAQLSNQNIKRSAASTRVAGVCSRRQRSVYLDDLHRSWSRALFVATSISLLLHICIDVLHYT